MTPNIDYYEVGALGTVEKPSPSLGGLGWDDGSGSGSYDALSPDRKTLNYVQA